MVAIEIIDDNIWRLVLYYFHEEFMLQLFVAGKPFLLQPSN